MYGDYYTVPEPEPKLPSTAPTAGTEARALDMSARRRKGQRRGGVDRPPGPAEFDAKVTAVATATAASLLVDHCYAQRMSVYMYT